MKKIAIWSLAASAALVAGCSGGSGTSIAPIAKSTTLPSGVAKSAAKLVITLPNRKGAKRYALGNRQPKYISPSTQGIIASATGGALAPGTTAYQGFTLAADATASENSPATCGDATNGSFTCTLYFELAPSDNSYSVTLTAYDAAESGNSGTPAGTTDNALSTDTESFTVAANTANVESFTLEGIVRGFYATRQYHGISSAAGSTSVVFYPLDADGNPITGSENLAYYNGSSFVEGAAFTPVVTDEHCLSEPCFTLDSPGTTITSGATGTVTVDYNGQSDPGTPGAASNAAPGYGQVALSAPAGYVGYSGSPSGTAATEYLEPFFPAVDQTANPSYASGATSVAFTQPGQSITAYGLQANMNSGSAGYSVDDSDCSKNTSYNDIADAGPLSPNDEPNISTSVMFGTMFTITAGSPTLPEAGAPADGLSCTIKIYDDNATNPTSGSVDEADITVTYAPNGSTITLTPGTPVTPNARTRRSR